MTDDAFALWDPHDVRWLMATVAAGLLLLLTFPVLASGSSDDGDLGRCTSAVGVRTLGTGESCDTWGVVLVLPAALLLFALVAWLWWHYLPGQSDDDHSSAEDDLRA
jgi:nitrogen fixation-related uncharacterized protein